MKGILLVVFVLAMPVAAYGETTILNSIDRAIDNTPAPKGFDGIKSGSSPKPRRVIDGPFLISQGVVWGTTWWDVDSTRRVHALGCCKEKNKDLQEFVKRGDWGAFWRYQAKHSLVVGGITGGVKYATRRNRYWALRHAWVLLPTVWSTVNHAIPAYGNEQLFRKYQKQ